MRSNAIQGSVGASEEPVTCFHYDARRTSQHGWCNAVREPAYSSTPALIKPSAKTSAWAKARRFWRSVPITARVRPNLSGTFLSGNW